MVELQFRFFSAHHRSHWWSSKDQGRIPLGQKHIFSRKLHPQGPCRRWTAGGSQVGPAVENFYLRKTWAGLAKFQWTQGGCNFGCILSWWLLKPGRKDERRKIFRTRVYPTVCNPLMGVYFFCVCKRRIAVNMNREAVERVYLMPIGIKEIKWVWPERFSI